MNTSNNYTEQVKKAAEHFISLYADEINEVSKDAIYEWWGQTKDQYEGVEYEDVEVAILKSL